MANLIKKFRVNGTAYKVDYESLENLPDLTVYAQESELEGFISGDTLSAYATKEELATEIDEHLETAGYLSSSDLESYLSTEDLSQLGFLSSSGLEEYLSNNHYLSDSDLGGVYLSEYVTTSGLESYLNANSYVSSSDLDSYVSSSDLTGYLSSENLSQLGYLSSSDMESYLSNNQYVKGYEVTSYLSEYVTTSYLSEYVTTYDLDDYVSSSDLDSYVSSYDLTDYLSRSNLSDGSVLSVSGLENYLSSNSYLSSSDMGNISQYLSEYVTSSTLEGNYLTDYTKTADLDSYIASYIAQNATNIKETLGITS